jgi:hypothetical protein
MRHGDPARAETVLRFALTQAPDNPRMLANDAQALRRLGREDEAKAYEVRLAAVEPYPPFYFYNRGEAALKAGDLADGARDVQARDRPRARTTTSSTTAGGRRLRPGRVDEARSELALALENSVKRTDHDLYAAKLDKLKAYRHDAKPSRLKLFQLGIGINDADNGMFLPATGAGMPGYPNAPHHKVDHAQRYHLTVFNVLQYAADNAQGRNTLRLIKGRVLSGALPLGV